MPNVDQPFPEYVGGEAIRLTLSEANPNPVAGELVVLTVDYGQAEIEEGTGEGVVKPLDFRVFAPDGSVVTHRTFSLTLPRTVEFEATAGPGSYMARLGELFHDRWWGALVVRVAGELEG